MPNSLGPLNAYHPENSQAPYWISHCNYDVHPLVSHACPASLSLPEPAPLLIAHCTLFHYFQTRKLGENSFNFQSYNLTLYLLSFPPFSCYNARGIPPFFYKESHQCSRIHVLLLPVSFEKSSSLPRILKKITPLTFHIIVAPAISVTFIFF